MSDHGHQSFISRLIATWDWGMLTRYPVWSSWRAACIEPDTDIDIDIDAELSSHLFHSEIPRTQSLDNQILVYSSENLRQTRKKRFAGHSVARYACQVVLSPDGKLMSLFGR
jgi:hypothetical protein